MSNNMENLLMDSGSSSGESDDEVDVPTGRPVGTAVVSPAPKPAPVTAPSPAVGSSAEDQMKARLKNLYQTQNKRPAPSASSHPPSSKATSMPRAPTNPRTGISHSSNPLSSHLQVQAPSLKQTMPPSQQRTTQPQQQRQKQQMPPVRSPLPTQPGQYSRRTHSSHTTSHTHGTHPSQSSRSNAASQRPSSHTNLHDPYAPTPLSKIQARDQQQLGRLSSSNSRPSSSMPGSHSGSRSSGASSQRYSSSSGSRTDPSLSAREQEVRKQKERFLVFTRVLIKYLEQKDPRLHQQAKAIIKDCAERNKKKEPGYQSVTASMKTRLKELVGEGYWRKAEVYLKHYLDQHKNKTGTQGVSLSSRALKQQQLEQQKLQQHRQRTAQLEAQRRAAQPQRHQQQPPDNLATLQQEVSNRRSEIAGVGGLRTATNTNVKAAKAPVPQQKKPTAPKGKSRTAAQTSRKPGTPVVGVPEGKEEPPEEYIELMQLVDHSASFDQKFSGQLIKDNTAGLHVNDEQKLLLYTGIKPKPAPPRKKALQPGWDKTNVFTARAAWARVRLPERDAATRVPVVGGGLLTLPSTISTSNTKSVASWTNEEKAEEDIVLAMLSEGCQQYLRGVLSKAVYCARQRQNVDGVRLWYQQQCAAAVHGKAPPLSLRLGCDISQQVALATGNAAMTCKRLEEALGRQNDVHAVATMLCDETLQTSSSMGDLSFRPQLGKALESADVQGRKSYDLFTEKHSIDPPLGSIPKKAKVEMIDLVHGFEFEDKIGRHRAVTASVAASYY